MRYGLLPLVYFLISDSDQKKKEISSQFQNILTGVILFSQKVRNGPRYGDHQGFYIPVAQAFL
jgi:3-polyprenyl-4-hydroxybenzoate decarboxylase